MQKRTRPQNSSQITQRNSLLKEDTAPLEIIKLEEAEDTSDQVIIGNVSLKINFDGKLDTQILKDATAGLDSAINSVSSLYASVLGENVKISRSHISAVKAGSCDFQGISLVIEKSTELAKIIKGMNPSYLLIICITGTVLYSVYKLFNYLEKKKIAETGTTSSTVDNSVHIQNSPIEINIGDELLRRFPQHEQEARHVAGKIESFAVEQPSAIANMAKGLIKMAHPGSAEVTSIVATDERENGSTETTVLLGEDDVKKMPLKYPKEERPAPSLELYRNVQIEVVKIDRESSADNALQCRIIDENYSNKRQPLIIDDTAMREEVMRRFPKNMNVDVFALKKIDSKGKESIIGYVLKEIHD